jgi:hypothetical protein
MIRRRRPPRRSVFVAAAIAAAVFASVGWAVVFTNPAAITINDNASATPYPSNITASGLSGGLTAITATISGLNHNSGTPGSGGSTDDVDILLAGPNGKTVVLMSDAGGFNGATNLTLTFSDSAANSLPDSTALASGTFKPTNYGATLGCTEPSTDTWPAPAPAGPYGSTMASMATTVSNGTYSLYVVDDCLGDFGSIASGWSINVTAGGPTAVALRSFGALPSRQAVVVHWRTASEASLLGFNVYRGGTRLNRALIPAKASATVGDGAYRMVDRSARPGRQYTYRLQAVALTGQRTWVGSAFVRIAAG